MSTLLDPTVPVQLDLETIAPGDKAWGRVTNRGLEFNATTDRETWLEVTTQLAAYYQASAISHMHSRFLLGDALNFGEQAYGEEYAQVIDNTRGVMKLSAKTTENLAWISSRIPLENRRDDLTITHHEIVAALDPAEQSTWLDKAESEAMTTQELRKEVRAAHPPKRKQKKATPVDGKEYTETQVKDAFEILLTYFQPLTEKRAKATDEQKATFGVQSEELAKILSKLNK